MQARITVVAATRQVTVAPVERVFRISRPMIGAAASGGPTWEHPDHPATRITMDADGGLTIESDVRITIRNTTTGDEANYTT